MAKKPKRRSVSSYRAASLKAWRTRRRIREARLEDKRLFSRFAKRFVLDDVLPPEKTINRIPKVEWT